MTKRAMQLSYGILLSAFMLFAGTAQADSYSQGYDHAFDGDYKAAYSEWMPLARAGDARAQFNLALIYHGGLLGPIDEAMAVHWYREAAKNGIREAQEYLVAAYSEGWFGLDRNTDLARYWEDRLHANKGL